MECYLLYLYILLRFHSNVTFCRCLQVEAPTTNSELTLCSLANVEVWLQIIMRLGLTYKYCKAVHSVILNVT